MIYKTINIQAYDRSIHLEFNSRTTLLMGDSGIGKTLLYNLLDNLDDEMYAKIVCINSKYVESNRISMLDILKREKNKLIVIDNAEQILGMQERKFICQNHSNQYLILGRCIDGLGLGAENLGMLVVTKKEMYIKYEEMEMLNEIKNRPLCLEFKIP